MAFVVLLATSVEAQPRRDQVTIWLQIEDTGQQRASFTLDLSAVGEHH